MTDTIRVNFEQLAQPIFSGLPYRMSVTGSFSRRGGEMLTALVGRQVVEAISMSADGSGFTGYLAAQPAPGDELILKRGFYSVATGARVGSGPRGQALDADAALIASVPPAQSRTLGVDIVRGLERFGATGLALPAASLERSWIMEEPSLTPDTRAFKPRAHDKTCRVTLAVRVPRLPSGGSIRWNVPTANRGTITLSGNPNVLGHTASGPRADVIGLVPGLTFLDVLAFDAAGRQLESIKFPLCVPQFVEVRDSAVSEAALAGFNLGGEKDAVFEIAKQICELILVRANVRVVWNMPPLFREVLPPQFATGGVAAARVTKATIQGNPPQPSLYGRTSTPYGHGVHDETIDVFIGAYDDAATSGAVEEVDEMTVAAVRSIASLTNMSSPLKQRTIDLIGRLIGETLAHEIGHSLVGPTLGGAHGTHNPRLGTAGALPHSLMNQGSDRSLTDRTGIRPIASPVSLDHAIDDGIAAINLPTGKAQTEVDAHFPVPPVFA